MLCTPDKATRHVTRGFLTSAVPVEKLSSVAAHACQSNNSIDLCWQHDGWTSQHLDHCHRTLIHISTPSSFHKQISAHILSLAPFKLSLHSVRWWDHCLHIKPSATTSTDKTKTNFPVGPFAGTGTCITVNNTPPLPRESGTRRQTRRERNSVYSGTP